MKLSMSLLAWYLRKYQPRCNIKNDQMIIEGMRFLVDESLEMLPQYVYFGNIEYFFTNHDNIGEYMIVHGNNTLFFKYCDYNTLLNDVLSAFDYFNSWESRLLEAASAGEPVQNILSVVEEVITNPAVIGAISDGAVTASNKLAQNDPYWNYNIRHQEIHPALYTDNYYDSGSQEQIKEFSEEPRLVKNVYPQGAPVLILYLKEGAEYVSCFCILQEDESLTEMNIQLAAFASKFLTKAREFTDPAGKSRAAVSIIQDLLNHQNVGTENLRLLSARLPEDSWRLVIFQHTSRNDIIEKRAFFKHLTISQKAELQWIQNEQICAVIREAVFSEANAFAEYLPAFTLAASMPLKGDASSLPFCYEQALFSLQSSHGSGGIFRCEDYAFSWLLEQLKSRNATAYLLHPALKTLKLYDQENHTELRETLHQYLINGCVSLQTAQKMHLHPNTMKYRLNKIRELTGLELHAGDDLRYLHLSDWIEYF